MAAAEGEGEAAAPASLVVEGDAAVGVGVAVAEPRGGAKVSIMMAGLTEVLVLYKVDVIATSLLILTALAVGVGVELSLALAGDEAEPTGQSMLLKVTRAFSASQERFAELKRARMMSDDKEMLKLDFAPEIRRGMDSPRVTLLYTVPFELVMVVVVQPAELATAHVEPVKPLAQMHEQAFEEIMLVPPLAHGVVCWHWASWDAVFEEVEEDLLMTRRNNGTRTAAATMRSVTNAMRRKTHIGSPQQRRLGFDPGGPLGLRGALVEAM